MEKINDKNLRRLIAKEYKDKAKEIYINGEKGQFFAIITQDRHAIVPFFEHIEIYKKGEYSEKQ